MEILYYTVSQMQQSIYEEYAGLLCNLCLVAGIAVHRGSIQALQLLLEALLLESKACKVLSTCEPTLVGVKVVVGEMAF